MNLRFSGDEVRFRITRDELARLGQGESLHEEVLFPGGGSLSFGVRVDPGAGFSLRHEGARLSLVLSPSAFQTLAEKGRSRDGLESDVAVGPSRTLHFSLEVDLRGA